MTQTPLTKAIEQLRKAPTDFNYKDDATLTVEDVLNILTDLLPYERDVIQNSHIGEYYTVLHNGNANIQVWTVSCEPATEAEYNEYINKLNEK